MATTISTPLRFIPLMPVLWVLLSCLCISVMGVLVKQLGHHLSSFQIAFFRAAFALVMILPLVWAKGPSVAKTKRPLLLIGRGLAGTIGMMAGFFAIVHMPLADATAIGFTTPLFIVMLAGLVLGESISPHHWIATAIGFCGVIVLVQPNGGFVAQDAALAALMGAMAVATVKLMLRSLAQTEETLTILVYATVVMTVATAVPAWLTWQTPTGIELLVLLVIGLLANLGQFCMINGYRCREASDLAPFEYSRLLFALLFGVLVFAEFPTTATLFGAGTIVLSNLYISIAAPDGRGKPIRHKLPGSAPKQTKASGARRRQEAPQSIGYLDMAKDQRLRLMPDRQGSFQRRIRTSSHLHEVLVEEVRRRLGSTRPRIILCCGKCRVGSTALANVFGHAGLPACYQPLKTLLRHFLVDQPCPAWTLETERPVIFVKETFGPYVSAECVLNPLDVLLDAGVPKENIVFLLMEREPLATYASWRRCWRDRLSEDELRSNFLLASAQGHYIRRAAQQRGIPVHDYIHEECREPEIAIPRLFESLSLKLRYDPSVLHGWTVGNGTQGTNEAVTFFAQPVGYRIEEIHAARAEYRLIQRHHLLEDFGQESSLSTDLPWLQGLYHAAWNRAESERPFCFPSRAAEVLAGDMSSAQQEEAA